jgi:pimeloyl-ACP methyl ester carboxylesterase
MGTSKLPTAIKLILTLLLALLVLAAAGWLLERSLRRQDVARYAGASFVDWDGRRVRVNVSGPEGRGPTIVLEAGLFDVSSDWHWIQTALSNRTRVFSYDRPGTGFSEALPGAADGRSVATRLRGILKRAGLPPPYVMVGHSIGGSFALIYAALFPEDVQGLVLLEPVHPDEFTRQPAARTAIDRAFFRRAVLMRWPAAFSLARWLKPFTGFGYGLPPEIVQETEALNASATHLAGVVAEIEALDETKNQQRSVNSLGALPLAILSAKDPPGEATAAYQEMHREMIGLSSRATPQVFADGNHSSIVHDQTASLRSVALIQEVWEKAPRGR